MIITFLWLFLLSNKETKTYEKAHMYLQKECLKYGIVQFTPETLIADFKIVILKSIYNGYTRMRK